MYPGQEHDYTGTCVVALRATANANGPTGSQHNRLASPKPKPRPAFAFRRYERLEQMYRVIMRDTASIIGDSNTNSGTFR